MPGALSCRRYERSVFVALYAFILSRGEQVWSVGQRL